MSELEGLKLLKRIEEGVAGKSGDAFFRQIVRDIADALSAHAAFTSRLLPGRRARMLAFWCEGHYEECLEYSLTGTPCEFVYRGEITCFGRDIGNIFPVDREWFRQLGVNSYLGIPIVDETGEVHGHLAVMDRPERDWHEADMDVLRLFSLRTAVELERNRAHRLLEESNESLRQANARLQSEVERRIATEEALAKAKAAAESANRAKSEFISRMSHELRTPLNGILGYAQLLRRQEHLNEQQRDGLDVIARSGEHLLNLVNDLLDLAKIEAGRLELRVSSVHLPTLLQDVVDLVRARAEAAGLELSFERPEDLLPYVLVDERALRQVLLNLLGNAIKFTDRGGRIALRVRVQDVSADRARLGFAVSDSGIGIPAGQLSQIFEPFHRVDDTARRVEGTGLGLAITRHLVEAMQGRIDVRSTPGAGTTFAFDLELDRAPGELDTRAPSQSIVGYGGRRRRVLVVDDDDVNRALVARLLGSLGFEVSTAENGEVALVLLGSAVSDLVVTDLVMPGIDGIELARTLRQKPAHAATRIIGVSASASEVNSQEAIQAGCDAFLPKPLRLADLVERIGALLELEWMRTDAPQDDAVLHDDGSSTFTLDPGVGDELYHLAMLGDVTGLLERASTIAESDPAAIPFCERLRSLAGQYDTGAIRRVLAAHVVSPPS